MLLSEKSQSSSQLELSESPADEKLDFLLNFSCSFWRKL